ncbi:helix-turn-helix domain-containing protein [Paenibacillus sp. GCM10027626]|uniref:helix-turn-helix domain-containing protein n=1 Tax=Paenibacillus sp. GCM10027626 TaxID=3273411 RepID=UPI00364424D1
MITNVYRSNLAMLDQIRLVVDNRMQEVERLTLQIAMNPKLQVLLSNDGEDSLESRAAFYDFIRDLDRSRMNNSFIDDFYVYLNSSQTIISPIRKAQASLFFEHVQNSPDPGYPDIMMKSLSEYHRQLYLPSLPLGTGNAQKKVLTYIQSLTLGQKSSFKGSLVIQIDEQQIKDLANQLNWVSQGHLYMMDPQGELLMTTSDRPESITELVDKMNSSAGYRSDVINGEQSLLSYTVSENNGWQYISVVPRSIIMSGVDEIKTRAIILLVICLMAGMVACYLMAYRNYSPIRDMIEAIVKGSRLPGSKINNEMEFIKDTLIDSMHEEKYLRDTLSRQEPVIRANFLSRLFRGQVDQSTITDESLGFMGVHFQSEALGVILIDIENGRRFAKEGSEPEWVLIQFVVSNICKELLRNDGYVVELDRQRLAVLMSISNKDYAVLSGSDRLRSFAEQLKEMLDRNQIQTTMAVSSVGFGLSHTGRAYAEALAALDYRITKGQGTIISYEEIAGMEQRMYHYPLETENQIINMAKSGDFTGIEKQLEQIYEINFVNYGITPEVSKCLFFDMTGTLLKLQNVFSGLGKMRALEGNDPVKSVLGCTTAGEMFEKTKEWYSLFCIAVNEERPDHGEKLFKRIKDHVEAHCTDPNFGLAAMADDLGLTQQYLSVFFKKYCDQNLKDYISVVRIRVAKQLLTSSDLTVTQVAKAIGYANEIGLIRLFKKYEGITPGKYREVVGEIGAELG